MADNTRETTRSPQEEAQRQLFDLLYVKVSEDKYPSPTMLDVLERLMTPDDVEDYAELLMSKIRDETYPSMSMVRRVLTLDERIGNRAA